MKGVLLGAACVSAILFLEAAAAEERPDRKAEKERARTVIGFDALTREFDHPLPKRYKAGTRVTLRLRNVNTFTEVYRLRIKQTDYHTNPLPNALKPFINIITPSTTETPKPQSVEATRIPERLGNSMKELVAAGDRLYSTLATDPPFLADAELDNRIARSILTGRTNIQIRHFTLLNVEEYFKLVDERTAEIASEPALAGDPEAPELKHYRPLGYQELVPADKKAFLSDAIKGAPPVPEAEMAEELTPAQFREARALLFRMMDPVTDGFKPVQARLAAFRAAWSRLAQEMNTLRLTLTDAEIVAVNQLFTKLQAYRDSVEGSAVDRVKTLRLAGQRIERARLLFERTIDVTESPGVLNASASASKDELGVEIEIEPIPFEQIIKVEVTRPEVPALPGGPPVPPAPEPPPTGLQPAGPPVVSTFGHSAPIYGRWVLDFGGGLVATTLTDPNFHSRRIGSGPNQRTIVRQGPSDRVELTR